MNEIAGQIIRQGDVYLIPRRHLPRIDEGWKGKGIKEVAFKKIATRFRHIGENGNHMHVIDDVNVLSMEGGATWLYLDEPRVMRHQKLSGGPAVGGHTEVEVPAGYREVRIQQQWRPNGRRVHGD